MDWQNRNLRTFSMFEKWFFQRIHDFWKRNFFHYIFSLKKLEIWSASSEFGPYRSLHTLQYSNIQIKTNWKQQMWTLLFSTIKSRYRKQRTVNMCVSCIMLILFEIMSVRMLNNFVGWFWKSKWNNNTKKWKYWLIVIDFIDFFLGCLIDWVELSELESNFCGCGFC